MKNLFISEIEFGTPEFDSAISLRDKILRQPLKLEFTEEQIAEEFDQIHFGCFDQNYNLLACLSFQIKNNHLLKMRQVAVDEFAQNNGIGSYLVTYTEHWAKKNGYKKFMLHARDLAVPFYTKLGYLQIGEQFKEVNIPHYLMEKVL
jgi:predicted GNAT family N-acyltransferase